MIHHPVLLYFTICMYSVFIFTGTEANVLFLIIITYISMEKPIKPKNITLTYTSFYTIDRPCCFE